MLLHSFRVGFLCCLLSLFSFSTGWAETDFSKGLLQVKELITTASKLTVDTCPNADEVLVDDYIRDEYNPDGTGVTWDDTLVKVLTEKGKRERQSLSFHFNEHYSDTTVTLLQIIKPDGKV
ncbi:TPA: hypothetical protein DDW35_12700, partial [Candidatus Sumerlaeota bacterium]|nr:hypothetical protein [Candidatus Sumerlaeota bacterium]